MKAIRLRNRGPLSVVVFVMLAGAAQSLSAQHDDVSEQLWLQYVPRWVFPSNLELVGDFGFRTEFGEQDWRRVIVRPSLRTPVGSFRLSGGVGGFFTSHDRFENRFEIRPFQGIAATWPSRRILGFDHYLRAEERFQWGGGTETTNVSIRLRYRLRTQYALPGPQGRPPWRVRAVGEAFLTVVGDAGQFRETARLGLGIGREFGNAWGVWLDATWQKIGRVFTGAPTNDFYIRVRVDQHWIR